MQTSSILAVQNIMCFFCLFIFAALFSVQEISAQDKGNRSLHIQGSVVDQTGAPVADAEVSLRDSSSNSVRATTDADGRFTLNSNLETGTLQVRARGFARFERAWRRDQQGDQQDAAQIEITLGPASLAEEVTVTATRVETELGDTAASLRILSTADLSTTAAITLDDALRQVPGFSLFRRAGSRTANPTAQGVSLRGVGASGASRAVVLADGIPLNDPFGGWVYWGYVPREAISRVEVLRGGASNLYGSAALGGAVQVITREIEESPTLSFEASYGNQQTPDASIFTSRRLNKWGASLAAETFHTDGYILVDESERGSVDTLAGSRRANLTLTIERFIADGKRLFVRGSTFGESRTNGTPLQINRTHIRQLVAGGDFQTESAGTFTLRAYGSTQVFDQTFSAISADRNSESLTRLQRVPAQVFGFTSQWSSTIGPKNALVVGIDAREVRGASDEIIYTQGRPSSLVGAGGRERTIGLFAQDTFRLTPQLFITGGARLDRWRNIDALQSTRPFPQSGPTAATTIFPDRSETAFSPQASLLYKPTENISLMASMTRAFRAPTLNELYRAFRVGNVLTLANENLRAERLTGGEVGASVSALKRRLDLRATLFWSEITRTVANVTLRETPALITRQRQNLGRTRSRGLELETDARITNELSISGGYAFTDATVLKFPANTALEGLLLPQVPRHYFSFQMRYTNPSIITLGLQGRTSSAQFDDDQNRFRLGRYFTLDALASRRLTREADIFLAAENLFNQRYDIGRTPVRTLGPPILFRAGIRLRFGAR